MKSAFDLSICIVNWNTRDLLHQCIASIYENISGLACEILVVDNCSDDKSAEMVASTFPEVKLIRNNRNVGFARANNQMLKMAQGESALLLNSDTIVMPDSLFTLINFMRKNPRAGACGPRLVNKDLSYQRSFMDFPMLSYELRYHLKYHFPPFSRFISRIIDLDSWKSYQPKIVSKTRVNVIPGACFLIRMEAYRDIGGMSEEYFLFSEENDWCSRLKGVGWEVFYVPTAQIIHFGGASTKKAGPEFRDYNFYLSRYKFIVKTSSKHRSMAFRIINLFFWSWVLFTSYFRRLITSSGDHRDDLYWNLRILSIYLS